MTDASKRNSRRLVSSREAQDTVQMGLRVPRALRDKLDRLAFEHRRSLNGEAQLALEQYVLREKEKSQ